MMPDPEMRILQWMTLGRMIPSPIARAKLLADFPNPADAIQAADGTPLEKVKRGEAVRLAEEELTEAKREGIRIITPDDQDYPALLRQIPDPPAVLYVKGSVTPAGPSVAVVGSRRPSPYGLRMAESIACGLAEAGVAVVSGLAYGVDASAHRAATESGGVTIAILGSGLLNIYPGSNRGLADRIVETSGAIVSEYPLHAEPESWHFPERNRIVAGWSQGVCVVEAAKRSGALITARLAGEYNRLLWVVPHQAGPGGPEGSLALLRDGATAVGEAAHILADLAPQLERPDNFKDDSADDAVLDCIRSKETVSIEELIEHAAIGREIVLQRLLQLEISGKIEQVPGGRFRRRR